MIHYKTLKASIAHILLLSYFFLQSAETKNYLTFKYLTWLTAVP